MPYNPTLPADAALVDAGELRNQFNGLQTNVQAKAFEDDCVGRQALCAVKPTLVDGLGMVVSDPPTQAEVQALADKLDELLAVLKG